MVQLVAEKDKSIANDGESEAKSIWCRLIAEGTHKKMCQNFLYASDCSTRSVVELS